MHYRKLDTPSIVRLKETRSASPQERRIIGLEEVMGDLAFSQEKLEERMEILLRAVKALTMKVGRRIR